MNFGQSAVTIIKLLYTWIFALHICFVIFTTFFTKRGLSCNGMIAKFCHLSYGLI